MKIIIGDIPEIEEKAALQIRGILEAKPDAVIALAAGKTMTGLYKRLGDMCAAGEISFRKARLLAVAEFVGKREKSCRRFIEDSLLRHTDALPENSFWPDPERPEGYEELIASLGGLDLAVLGIGQDTHIGYNEPATPFDSITQVQKLTNRTKHQLSERGYSEAEMPGEAVTMGLKTLVGARQIIVLAEGGEKSAAVFQMVYSKTITYIPASFLQIPLEVTAYFDTAAASEL